MWTITTGSSNTPRDSLVEPRPLPKVLSNLRDMLAAVKSRDIRGLKSALVDFASGF